MSVNPSQKPGSKSCCVNFLYGVYTQTLLHHIVLDSPHVLLHLL